MQSATPAGPNAPQHGAQGGFGFPMLTVPVPPAPGHIVGGPVVSGGGVVGAGTVTRVRWGRILLVFAGAALIGVGAWNATGSIRTDDAPRTASGGGAAADVDIARAARSGAGAPGAADDANSDGGTEAPAGEDAAGAAPAPPATPPASTPSRAPKQPAARAGSRAGGGTASAAPRTIAAPTTSPIAPRAVAGGGGADAQLPYTGIETWIAAFLGVLLLGLGICVHVNAVRIGMTAMLYRRGILLRPVDCARLAQQRGVPQLRVAVSNLLHRLLEEPAGSDFVTARRAMRTH